MQGTFSVSHQIEPAVLYFGTPVVLIGSSNEDGLARNSETTANMIRAR
jgi:flavin reductase (DIM6/NTAB) family NADH-FMN oxidoreductase RutF